MQHPSAPQPGTPFPQPSETSPQRPGRRPWLPLRHVIGLIAVFVFIVGALTGGWMFITGREAQMAADSAEREAANSEDIYVSMSLAMLNDDREGFVRWAEGDAREQLERIWDESKEIGWTVGMVDGAYSDEELQRIADGEFDYDPERPHPDGMLIAFDLGFTQERFPDGAEAGCGPDAYDCGTLTQVFEYDVTVDAGDGSTNSHRIVELEPRTPMPWDDPDGVHAVHRDRAVVFGYADEAERIDAVADEVGVAADGVLQTEVATSGYSNIPGFPVLFTDDPERYSAAVYGVGEHAEPPDRDWVEAGVTKISPSLDIVHEAMPVAEERGLNLAMGQQGGSLPVLNGAKITEDGGSVLRVAAHELAHALEMTTFAHLRSLLDEPTAHNFGTEGYAVYVEDLVASPHDGRWRSLEPDVRAAVVNTPDSSLDGLVGDDAFKSSSSTGMAYAASGNYFAFMADRGVSLAAVMHQGQYDMFDPYHWIGMHYAETPTGETVKATPDEWRAWNASQETP